MYEAEEVAVGGEGRRRQIAFYGGSLLLSSVNEYE